MIFHHCFCIPERLNYNYITLFSSYETGARLAGVCKICVGLYAFVTGYGLGVKAGDQKNVGLWRQLKGDIRYSLNNLIRLYSRFCLVYLIYIPLGGLVTGCRLSLSDFIQGLLLEKLFNIEWWYIKTYIKFLLLYPVLDLFGHILEKIKIRMAKDVMLACGGAFLAVTYILKDTFWGENFFPLWKNPRFSYFVIFIFAYYFSRFRYYSILDAKIRLSPLKASAGIFLLLGLRCLVFHDLTRAEIDIILVLLFIYFAVSLLHSGALPGRLASLLKYLGGYSTYMWLIHTFWIYYYFQNIILLPKISIFIYLWAVLISLMNAIGLQWLYDKAGEIFGKAYKTATARLPGK